MNNIDLIKEDYNIGDSIRISCSLGVKEGVIISFMEDRIKLRPQETGRKPFSIQDSTITDWEEGSIYEKDYMPQVDEAKCGEIPIADEEKIQIDAKQESQMETVTKQPPISAFGAEHNNQNENNLSTKVADNVDFLAEDKTSIHIRKVGYISPDELLQIDPKLKKKKMSSIGKDFSVLATLVSEKDLTNREKYVQARGEIQSVHATYGFIYDPVLRKQIYFSSSQIVDPEIKIFQAHEQPVVYQVVDGEQGPKAVFIHKPSKIGKLIELSEQLLKEGRVKAALGVIDNILIAFPDNEEVLRRKNSISSPSSSSPNFNASLGENYYRQAERANHVLKDYSKAIELYKKAIEVGDRAESAIKDLCMMLLSLYKSNQSEENKDRAIETLLEYRLMLPTSSLANLNFLESFYFSMEQFDEYDKVLDLLLEHPAIKKDSKKQSEIFVREAASYLKRNDIENAQYAIDDALTADPYNKGALNLQNIIKDPNLLTDERISTLFNASDFIQLSNGLSPFIQNTLSEYTEFYGVPESVALDVNKFSNTTLKGVRALIEKARGRARERAKYLLTEAKLISIIDPDNSKDIKDALIKYCNSMANTHLAENSHMDVVRFYYNEAFALSNDSYRGVPSQVSDALLTYIYSPEQILTQKVKTKSVGNVIEIANQRLRYPLLWDALLGICLNNREISAHIVDYLYKSGEIKEDVIRYLNDIHSCNLVYTSKESAFREAWDAAREHRSNSKATFRTKFRIIQTKSIEDFSNIYLELTEKLPDWLPDLDRRRLNSIRDRIVPALDAYIKSQGYRNKETSSALTIDHINQLIADINEQPTEISYNLILPFMVYLNTSLNQSFNDVKLASKPKLTISLLSTETVINNDNIVTFQISLSNDKLSAPIRCIKIFIQENDGVQYIPSTEELDYNSLEGGEEKVYKLSAKIDGSHITAQALPIEISVNYETNGIQSSFLQQISLKLYSPSEFIAVQNPYAPMADGGPVPVESNMFFGRKTFIENIVSAFNQTQSKQIIIYGQKRSGKSSVLYHLKDALQKKGTFFCVSFSLGDILLSLTEFSFYYKILSSIKDELDEWEWNHPEQTSPDFEIPSLMDFKNEDIDNPLNTFIKYIKLFKTICKGTQGWEEKNLVIMIDEFTYIYTGIKSGRISDSIMKQWKAITQNPKAQFSVVLVGQDVIPSFKKEDYARNAFGVIEDKRLTYLEDSPARALIENPIRMSNGQSRYVGRAVDRIIEYTSRNPYYIQIFCSRLVEYLNDNKSIYITEADVNSVASSFIKGERALGDDKFDNLIRAGENEDQQEFKDKDILNLLKQMAGLSNIIGFCREKDLDVLNDDDLTKRILSNLVDREVIERIGEEKYKIQIKLFQEWLLNH